MAKEKNLTTVTSVAAADFARLVTSAGASVKATAANLAKYVVETYNGSTVAGSAQSVKSALDSLNSKFGQYAIQSIMSNVAATYTTIDSSDGRIVYIRLDGNLRMILFHFKTSAAITSGSVNLSSVIDTPKTETYSALSALGGGTGFLQISENKTLYVRTNGGASGNYFNGQLIYTV